MLLFVILDWMILATNWIDPVCVCKMCAMQCGESDLLLVSISPHSHKSNEGDDKPQ